MPALKMHRREEPARHLHLVGVGLVLLLLASLGAAASPSAQARDWTPQIKATRQAQIYWESVMRAADKDVKRYERARKQAVRAVRKRAARTQRAQQRRAVVKRERAAVRSELSGARAALAATSGPPPPPPDPTLAAHALRSVVAGGNPAVVPEMTVLPFGSADLPGPRDALPAAVLDVTLPEVKALQQEARKQQRTFKKAKRSARKAMRKERRARARLSAAISGRRAAIARRESAERSLGARILAMERYGRTRAQKKSPVRPGVNASFAWPARGRITQTYSRSHDGLDIASYQGAPIRAAAPGVVSYIGWNPWDQHGRAFMVVVAHASGFETLYGHVLPRRSVRVGQEVRKGAVIGYMGSTGNSTGTHLHFELRRGRTTINPLGYL